MGSARLGLVDLFIEDSLQKWKTICEWSVVVAKRLFNNMFNAGCEWQRRLVREFMSGHTGRRGGGQGPAWWRPRALLLGCLEALQPQRPREELDMGIR